MQPNTYYLYEYERNNRLRNAGFLKLQSSSDSHLIRLHIKSPSLGSGISWNLHAFSTASGSCTLYPLDTVVSDHQSLHLQIRLSAEHLPSAVSLSQIDGLWLAGDSSRYFVAAWRQVAIAVENVVFFSEATAEPEADILYEAEKTQKASISYESDFSQISQFSANETESGLSAAENNTASIPSQADFAKVVNSSAKSTVSNSGLSADESSTDSDTEFSETETSLSEVCEATENLARKSCAANCNISNNVSSANSHSDSMPNSTATCVPAPSTVQPSAHVSDSGSTPDNSLTSADTFVSDSDPALSSNSLTVETPASTNTSAPTPFTTPAEPLASVSVQTSAQPSTSPCQKISRQDLKHLPRRFWSLANNSFLLHGYYTYHHLLYIERNKRVFLGVPGVFSPKEQHAARLFGFPEFSRDYLEYLELDSDECSGCDHFGYWIRPVF